MMEAVSGSVTAAGIYLKVAAGMDKEERDRGNRERKRWPCNEREDLAEERERAASIPCVRMNRGPKVQGGEGGGSRDN